MKASDIIRKKSTIEIGKQDFFIAEEDFSFMDLPILEGSLVYYNGNNQLDINLISGSHFNPNNVPELIIKSLPKKSSFSWEVEKSSNCKFETDLILAGSTYLWHLTHLDKWNKYTDYIETVNNAPVIIYKDLTLSSLFYKFDIAKKKLIYFINLEKLKISSSKYNVELQGIFEVVDMKKINPLQEIEYFDIPFNSTLRISDEGTISGYTSEKIKAEIITKGKPKKILINKGAYIYVTNSGETYLGFRNPKTNKLTKQQFVVK